MVDLARLDLLVQVDQEDLPDLAEQVDLPELEERQDLEVGTETKDRREHGDLLDHPDLLVLLERPGHEETQAGKVCAIFSIYISIDLAQSLQSFGLGGCAFNCVSEKNV